MSRPRITGVAAIAVPDWRLSPPDPQALRAVSFWIIDDQPWIHDMDGWQMIDMPPGFTPPLTRAETVVKPKPRSRR